jgi:hypothetical protein
LGTAALVIGVLEDAAVVGVLEDAAVAVVLEDAVVVAVLVRVDEACDPLSSGGP